MGENESGDKTERLTVRALDVYSRLSEEAAINYDQVKVALMKKRDDLAEGGYQRKVRVPKPESDDSPDQYIVGLANFQSRWFRVITKWEII